MLLRGRIYLAAVDAAVLDLGDDVALAADVDAFRVRLVDGGRCLAQDGDKVLHLGGLDLCKETTRVCVSGRGAATVLPGRTGAATMMGRWVDG